MIRAIDMNEHPENTCFAMKIVCAQTMDIIPSQITNTFRKALVTC